MGRRSVHSPEELRQLILDASQTIVERNGITGLSAREIARMIGYSPGTLYNIFENLDDVLLTLQVQLMGRTVEHLKHVPQGSDGEKNIEDLAQAYVDFALVNRRMWNLFLAHSLPPGKTVPAPFFDYTTTLAQIVKDSLAQVAPKLPTEDIDTTARAFLAGLNGICALAATEKGVYITPATAQTYAKELTSTFLKGLRCRSVHATA
ncbi:TetR/AcrR family transcriptional regulator [Hyphomicrobium sp.]|uniref:TetR/AcrR family transcriptional regulator n=1 Tax=Hyphomicrobium sp. TaxID=82 RepID=UPI000FA81387|nr:TetR/AcrR family transcriptional regulator [Hyphomicrobium sp.]RUO99762.1 MAG: TetR/AcrR family transcriptional regulator [Hyphomicrobium sp.]